VTSKLSRDDVAAALQASQWAFAKTMPHNPHWYTLRKDWVAKVSFEAVVQYIRDHGTERRFMNATYVYFENGGWTYWTTGLRRLTILINKGKILREGDPIAIDARQTTTWVARQSLFVIDPCGC
jgi:hypothetical protein